MRSIRVSEAADRDGERLHWGQVQGKFQVVFVAAMRAERGWSGSRSGMFC
jgi:hypothetical protein